jgi:hypothetical protein
MNIKKCPYYIVNNLDEFKAAVQKMSTTYTMQPLHEFPMIVGNEAGFGIFQSPGKAHPLKPYEDLVYELKTLKP